jgi:hypothetical protein
MMKRVSLRACLFMLIVVCDLVKAVRYVACLSTMIVTAAICLTLDSLEGAVQRLETHIATISWR